MSERFDYFADYAEVPIRAQRRNGCGKPVCDGAIAAQAAVPSRDMAEIADDIAEVGVHLDNAAWLINRARNNLKLDAEVRQLALQHVTEAMRQLAAIRAACEEGQR